MTTKIFLIRTRGNKALKIYQNNIYLFQSNNFDNIRNKNDKNNKIREHILINLINNTIPLSFFDDTELGKLWSKHKTGIQNIFMNHYKNLKLTAEIKGGRTHNYDFSVKCNNIEHKWEFKYGVNRVSECPQFSSPSNISQYLNINFEEYFYDNGIPKIFSLGNFGLPDKELYLKQINSISPPCMKSLQDKYYKGSKTSSQYTGNPDDIRFYNECINISKQTIYDFLTQSELKLNIEKLNQYFKTSQKEKNYLLCRNHQYFYETIPEKEYTLTEEYTLNPPYIYCKTLSGSILKIMIRFKNGNGIAYPAFQVKLQN